MEYIRRIRRISSLIEKRNLLIWVEQYNGIYSMNEYLCGDELIIPVKDSAVEINDISNLASN